MDLDYDEAHGNPAQPGCLMNIAKEERFYTATEDVLPWGAPGDGDDDRAVVPIAWLETLVRKARVVDPEELGDRGFLTSCLSAGCINRILTALCERGLVDAEDGDDDAVTAFRTFDQLQTACDKLIQDGAAQDPLVVEEDDWDDYPAGAAGNELLWLNQLTISGLTRKESTLEVYADLNMVVGPRALEAPRLQAASTIRLMAGGDNGGLLTATLAAYYFGEGAAVAAPPQLMAARLPDFLIDTRWPPPFNVAHDNMLDYSFDLPNRAKWEKATRGQWAALVRPKMVRALERLEPLHSLLEDHASDAARLVKEVQRIGDAVLTGETSQKMVFWRLEEINQHLADNYEGLIIQGREAGHSTDTLIDRLLKLLTSESERGREPPGEGAIVEAGVETIAPPVQAQLKRALGEASFAKLEAEFLPILQEVGQPRKEPLDMLAACFRATSVLPKAVLLATPGVRLSSYTRNSEFLDLLKDERDQMRLYIGQCMAFNDVEDEVPEGLRTFRLDEGEHKLLVSFQWDKLDPFNKAVMPIRAEEVGSRPPSQMAMGIYHDGEAIDLVREVYGKMFKGLGYPAEVDPKHGLTFDGFMLKIRHMQKITLAMEEAEAKAMFGIIDGFVQEAFKAAALNCKRVIYGANPADRRLDAWLLATDPVHLNLLETIKEVREIKSHRRRLPGVYGQAPEARGLPGLERDKKRKHEESEGQAYRGGTSKGGEGGKKGRECEDATEPKKVRAGDVSLTRQERLKHNPHRVFHYDDSTFSIKGVLFHWPKICAKYGWDPDKVCGPVAMSTKQPKNREQGCMNHHHK